MEGRFNLFHSASSIRSRKVTRGHIRNQLLHTFCGHENSAQRLARIALDEGQFVQFHVTTGAWAATQRIQCPWVSKLLYACTPLYGERRTKHYKYFWEITRLQQA